MLYLNKEAILKAVSVQDVIDAIDQAYEVYQSNQFIMPTRQQIIDGDNTLLLMPCLTEKAIGTKLVTSFPSNTDHPVLHGFVILNSQQNGEIMALMDGTFITGFRTGAIGGSAVRHLAKKDASTAAIIGTGVQGLYQAVAACAERPITDLYLYNRSPDKIPSFTRSLQEWLGNQVRIHVADTAEEAVQEADIIITATTSKEPVLPDNETLFSDKLVIGIGSFQPSMRELPQKLFQLADHVLVDSTDAITESGDLATPIEQGWIRKESVQTMSEHIRSGTAIQDGDTVFFKSTGMALFDVVVANLIYQKALEQGVGQELT